MKVLLGFCVVLFMFVGVAEAHNGFCDKWKENGVSTDLVYVDVYHNNYQVNLGDSAKTTLADLIGKRDNTVIHSTQRLYVASLYSFLCQGDFVKTNENWFDSADNYLAVFFNYRDSSDKESLVCESDEVFSSDGEYLYAGDGSWRKKIDKTFRLKFHFSDDDLYEVSFHSRQ